MVYGEDDGDGNVITLMAGGACMYCSIKPHLQIRPCEVAFETGCVHTCGETSVNVFVGTVVHVDIFVGAVALHVCG